MSARNSRGALMCLAAMTLALTLAFPAVSTGDDATLPITRYLDARSHSIGRLSDDGSRVLYLDRISGAAQVWMVATQGRAWPTQLTFFDERVQSVQWMPKAGELVFTKDASGNERSQLYWMRSDLSESRRLTTNDDAIHHWGAFDATGDRMAYRSNARKTSVFDAYIYDFATHTSELVYEGKGRMHVVRFSPDGRKLLLMHTQSSRESGLSLFDLETGHDRWLTPTDVPAQYYYHDWTDDRSGLWLVTDYRRDLLSVARLDLESGDIVYPRDDRWPVDSIELSEDGARMAIVFNEGGYSRLEVVAANTQRPLRSPRLGGGVITDVDMTPNGSKILIAMGSATRPASLYLYDVDADSLDWVTRGTIAGLPTDSLLEPQLITFTSFDGRDISGFLYDGRRDRTRPGPCVVYAHGGPASQRRPTFAGIFQYLAARGYVVFAPNVRGSRGYGREFMNLDNGERREDSVRDVISGVDALIDRGVVDRHRVGIYGTSYGGYVVLAALTLFPDRFACGIDRVGISNFVTFLEKTGSYRRALREQEYGSLEHDRAILERLSPIHRVDAIRAPLLVVHGENDPRVPIDEAVQIVDALRARQHPVEFLRLSREGHSLTQDATRDTVYTRMVEFLATHLDESAASEAPALDDSDEAP